MGRGPSTAKVGNQIPHWEFGENVNLDGLTIDQRTLCVLSAIVDMMQEERADRRRESRRKERDRVRYNTSLWIWNVERHYGPLPSEIIDAVRRCDALATAGIGFSNGKPRFDAWRHHYPIKMKKLWTNYLAQYRRRKKLEEKPQ